MILVDSSVWIDYFNGASIPQADKLDGLLVRDPHAMGDLILTEVLQGFAAATSSRPATPDSLTIIPIGGPEIAIVAAQNFRYLRKRGVTVRKTIDTRCIESGYDLLHSDRDFEPFVEHLGLHVV